MTTDPKDFEIGSKIAIDCHRRALADALTKLASLRKEPHGAEAVDDAIGGVRELAEVLFGTIRAQDIALAALMHEVAADRCVARLMVAAFLQQLDIDRDLLHANFLNGAKAVFKCGPESFPDQAREAAIMLSGKVPT